MSNEIRNQRKVFTWRNGPWICLRSNGIIYYSEKIKNQLFASDEINYVKYEITSSQLKIIPCNDKNDDNIKYYKLTYINNGARSFIKRTLNKNDFKLPAKSLRLFADISESAILVDLNELKS